MRLGVRVTAIDRAAQRLRLSDGGELACEKLLLCVGSRARRLDVPGADLQGIHYLRTIADVDVDPCGPRRARAGWWSSARDTSGSRPRPRPVTSGSKSPCSKPADRPMQRVVCPTLSEFYRERHEREGVRIHCNVAVERVYGGRPDVRKRRVRRAGIPGGRRRLRAWVSRRTDARRGRGAQVRQRDLGRRVTAGRPIRTSTRPATAPTIRACTTVAASGSNPSTTPSSRAASRRRHLRQGRAARPRAVVLVGPVRRQAADRGALAGSRPDRRSRRSRGGHFAIYYLSQGELIAVDAVNSPKDFMSGRRWIAERRRPDAAKLADPVSTLKSF